MDLVSNKSHHQFFKKLVSLWFLPILILFAGCAENQKDQPNVILVMADDMGWAQTGYYGHPILKTPNLDAMAENGLRMDRFYAGAPSCTPTRASVMTGRTNDRTGAFRVGSYINKQENMLSTAVKAGRFHVGAIFMNRAAGNRFGDPSGFGFSRDGMNLYLLDNVAGNGVHQINQYKLDCPYGLVKCSSDPRASVDSQVELAKQNISLNVTTIFKRFEWIKRNRDNEDLTSHNININYPNPLLKSLVTKFEPSLKNNLVSLISNNQKKEEKKKSKWSSWSLIDLSIGDYKEMDLDRAKGIKTKGITRGGST